MSDKKYTVSNPAKAAGARGVRAASGRVLLEPGESVKAALTDAEVDVAKAMGLKVGAAKAGKKADEGKPEELPSLSGMNKETLLATAEDEGVDVPEGAINEEIADAITKAREANA